jgi:hypothetical protein
MQPGVAASLRLVRGMALPEGGMSELDQLDL